MFTPATVDEAAAILVELGEKGQAVRPVGAGTRLGWGGIEREPVLEMRCAGLDRIVAHNAGDFTAVLEAGVPLDEAQAAFAGAGQWLAIDPPEPSGTVGGLMATADSGPSRQRYGGMRDLVIGVTVILSDGTVANAGGRVIKNVAGYDLGKLFTGSFGTLGLIASVAVRLHPLPAHTVTSTGTTDDPERLTRTVMDLARRPLEALCLDAWWRDDVGGVLVRFGGVAATEQAGRTTRLLDVLEAVETVEDDDPLWAAQRSLQRSAGGAVVKVSARPTDLPTIVSAARANGATVVARAGLGLAWLSFSPGDNPATDDLAARVEATRQAIAPRAATVLDGAANVPDPWPPADPGVMAVMQRVKARFDPARIFRPGAFVGGI